MSTPAVAPIQFGAPIQVGSPVTSPAPDTPATMESLAGSLNAAVEDAEQKAEAQVAQEQAQATEAEQQVTEAQAQTSQATAEAHTHATILAGLFTELEGFQNMGKSEIYAVVQRWNGEFKKL